MALLSYVKTEKNIDPAAYQFSINKIKTEGVPNSVIESSLKTAFNEGTAACQRVDVLIICKNEVISIPLSSKGCCYRRSAVSI